MESGEVTIIEWLGEAGEFEFDEIRRKSEVVGSFRRVVS